MSYIEEGYTNISLKDERSAISYTRWCFKCFTTNKNRICLCSNCYYRLLLPDVLMCLYVCSLYRGIVKKKSANTYIELISIYKFNKDRNTLQKNNLKLVEFLINESILN